MAELDVKNEIIEPMKKAFEAPPGCASDAERDAKLRQYTDALSGFDGPTLRKAWSKVRSEHLEASWPPVSNFVQAARASQKPQPQSRPLLIGIVIAAILALGAAAYYVFKAPASTDTAATSDNQQMAIVLNKNDRTMGSPKAPLTVVEYAAPTCPHCARFDMDFLPQFKQQYIDTGKVFYIFRVFPLNQIDVAAESMARCLPEDNYFQFIDLLYRNQPKWDPDGYQIADVHAALIDMARIAGMSPAQADSCMSNAAEQKRIQDVGVDAQTRYNVSGTPTFIAGGQTHGPFEDFDELKAFFDPLLAKK